MKVDRLSFFKSICLSEFMLIVCVLAREVMTDLIARFDIPMRRFIMSVWVVLRKASSRVSLRIAFMCDIRVTVIGVLGKYEEPVKRAKKRENIFIRGTMPVYV